ncbi:MAG: sulfatase-like hydrolase/transferase, partial [Vicingaceae bacterium]|nr:sulfatase-like hydrolase/transferase [Vicingaceae bacterium]
MNSYSNNLILLLKKLSIGFLVFSLSRILYYIFNTVHFDDVSITLFFYGLRFDLVSLSYLLAPLIFLQLLPLPIRNTKWYQKILNISFYLGISIGIILNLIDVAYFNFTLKRTTTDFFGMAGTGDDFFKLLPHYVIDFWYDYLLLAGLIYISWFLHKKHVKSESTHYNYILKDYLIHTIILVAFSGITIIGMRGGTQHKPIDIVNAGQYTKAQNIPIILNTPFTILKTLLIDNIEVKTYYSDAEIEFIYSPKTLIKPFGNHQGKNVVLIILESFAKEYVGGFNNGNGYTPFIDSLLTESYAFSNAYANGSRSIEALPCILAGLPQLMSTPYVISNYAGNRLDGLAKTLKNDGYNTSFYHGGANGTMGFNGFVGVAGIDNYFGINEYPNKDQDYDGSWGIFDEPYLQYFAKELKNKKEPFFSSIFTLSSHHPYKIPKKHKGKFSKGNLPLHKTIGYTDYALKQFFKTAQKMPWFKNTLFVFTADHSAQSNNKIYKTRLGRYAVPVFIYSPTGNLKGNNSNIFQHIDITPTVLSLTSKNKDIISFGNNAFDSTEKYTIQFIDNTYQITYQNNFLIFDGLKTINFHDLGSGR